MEKIKVIHDCVKHTLTIWLSDPKNEVKCVETPEDVILMKDKSGHVIGFELLHFVGQNSKDKTIGLTVETVVKTGT